MGAIPLCCKDIVMFITV